MTAFSELALRLEIQEALRGEGYTTPTPIQAKAIPPALEGRDLLGIAQTGTGKTAAFTLPILERLSAPREGRASLRRGECRALVLTPTRELAIQIGESVRVYGRGLPLRHAVIFGGVGPSPQIQAMARGVDIVIATPGRLLDLMQQGCVKFDRLETFVLDEADRMLDMGFIRDVRKVVAKLPAQRQSLFFSATMPDEVADLAHVLLTEPVRVEVAPVATTAERIDQRVVYVSAGEKRDVLVDLLHGDTEMSRTIVFTRTKHGADKVAKHLERAAVRAAAIHGNKSQSARQAALDGFKAGVVRVLVATDIAARGIDVDGVSHVINFDLPNEPESYVHRIGRTARAGASGIAIALCDNGEERAYLRGIEKLTRVRIPVMERPPRSGVQLAPAAPEPQPQSQPAPRSGRPAGPPQRRRNAKPGQAPSHDHRPADHRAAEQRVADHRNGELRGGDRPPARRPNRGGSFGDLVAAIGTKDSGSDAPRRDRPRRTGGR